MFYQFIHPFTMIISGPSGCGKSTFLERLIMNKNNLINEPNINIMWCYAECNAVPKINSNILFYQGIPEDLTNASNKPLLIILDDLMMDGYNKKVCELFTKGSHHRNISVILVTQNLFHKSSMSRDISLNTKYIVMFKNPRDQLQFSYLARQVLPENFKELIRVYKEITQTPHGFLLIDLTQDIHDSLRFRTNIFEKDYCVVFTKVSENGIENKTIAEQQAYVICVERC